jgi:hypothetical protein
MVQAQIGRKIRARTPLHGTNRTNGIGLAMSVARGRAEVIGGR